MTTELKRYFFGVIAILFMVSPATAVLAAPQPTPNGGSSGQGLEISPPVIELSANPGQTVIASIRLRNVTKGQLIAKGKADDFGAGTGEEGQPKLLLDETGETRFSLKYWVQGVPDLLLAPQELKANAIKIVVPKNAEPGGHFGVIRFTAVPPELEGTGVALSASIGALILLKVSGTIKEDVSLAEFSTVHSIKVNGKEPIYKKTNFFEYGPIDFIVRAHNDGSVHEKLKGTIEVKDWTGKNIGSVIVNDKGGNVLPGSIRRFAETLPNKQLFGHYSASLALTYSSGKKLNASLGFWVIPWKLILIVLVVVVILFFVLKSGLRRYNKHIIAQARKR